MYETVTFVLTPMAMHARGLLARLSQHRGNYVSLHAMRGPAWLLVVAGGWRRVSHENPRDARNAALSTPLLSLALVLLTLELRGLGPLSDLLRAVPARALPPGLGERGVAPDGDPRGWPRGPWKTGAA
jgi:hypothetical protein